MKPEEVASLQPGTYRLHWSAHCEGGSSECLVGIGPTTGERWWARQLLATSICYNWDMVVRCERLDQSGKAKSATMQSDSAGDRPHLFQLGSFTLNSGIKSAWKLELDALTDADWTALAEMVRLMVGPFSSVEGVPRGGLKLASLLTPHCVMPGTGQPFRNIHLIVDDVLTTGNSMERLRKQHVGQGPAGRPAIRGAVIFARGQCPSWIKAVFQMPVEFWLDPPPRFLEMP